MKMKFKSWVNVTLLCALLVFNLTFGQIAVNAFSDVAETSVFYDDI